MSLGHIAELKRDVRATAPEPHTVMSVWLTFLSGASLRCFVNDVLSGQYKLPCSRYYIMKPGFSRQAICVKKEAAHPRVRRENRWN